MSLPDLNPSKRLIAMLDECLNDEEPWEPERLVELLERIRDELSRRGCP